MAEYDSGSWHVVKYANGEAELSCRVDGVTYVRASSWGNSYYNEETDVTLPIELKKVKYARGSVANALAYDINIIKISNTKITYRFVSYAHDWSTQPNVTLMLYVRGNYK